MIVPQIQSAIRKLTERMEAGLVSCAALLIHIIPYLTDGTLLDILKVHGLVQIILCPWLVAEWLEHRAE